MSFGVPEDRILLIMLAAYFFPVIVASMRKAATSGMIFFTNLVIGSIGIGWLLRLLWTRIGQTQAQRAFYEVAARAAREPSWVGA